MAADTTPLTRLTLEATSVADDLSYVALAELSRVLADLDASFRIIGGHMVNALAAPLAARPDAVPPQHRL
jgi:hypothetical protein